MAIIRTVPINESLNEVLRSLQGTTTTPNDFVFPRIREWGMGLQAGELRKFCIEIGICSVKFHALRACFAGIYEKGATDCFIF